MNIQKKIKLLDFKLTKNLGASLFGLYKSRFTGNGIDFIKHKEYFFGDPIKNIDWKASSKTGKIYSKVFEDERDLKVLFLIKVGQSMNFGVFEKTKKDILEEIFYSIAMSASISGDSIGALLYGGNENIFIDYRKGFGNIFKVLSILQTSPTERGTQNFPLDKGELKGVFEYLQKRNFKNNLIFVLTDDMDLIDDNNLKLLSFSNEIIFFNIFDYFENNLSDLDVGLSLNNGNDFLNISLSDKEKVKDFGKNRQNAIKNFQNFLRKNKISYKIFDTKDDAFKSLYLFFKEEKY